MKHGIARTLRNNITVGLLLVTPLVVTAIVVNWLFNLMTNRLVVFVPPHLRDATWELFLFKVVALIVVLAILFLIGLLVRNILGKRLYHLAELLVTRIPVVSRIYAFFRHILEALFTQRDSLLKEVILIEFPQKGSWAVGFVTGVAPDAFRANFGDAAEEHVSVFVPTTPNPTSGWLFIVPRSKTRPVNISPGDAMKLVISGGAVYPGSAEDRDNLTLLDKLEDWMKKQNRSETVP